MMRETGRNRVQRSVAPHGTVEPRIDPTADEPCVDLGIIDTMDRRGRPRQRSVASCPVSPCCCEIGVKAVQTRVLCWLHGSLWCYPTLTTEGNRDVPALGGLNSQKLPLSLGLRLG